jgi:GPH family glycoside/pentoside/hexuronide:cation symporter
LSTFNENDKDHSIATYLSFGVLLLGLNGMNYAVVQNYPFFYQVQLGLNIGMIILASVFYTIWDMINDPLIGYFSDRTNRFTRRWGKRFPWLIIGNLAILLAVVLLFSAPEATIASGLLTFLWFLLVLSLYDGLYSTIFVNYKALLPNKFKTKDQRLKASSISQFFLLLGPVIGLIIAPQLLTDETSSYQTMALVLAIIMLFSFILSIPGLREEESLKESYFREEIDKKPFKSEFMGNLRQSFREKSFNVFALYVFAITLTSSMLALSIPYYIEFVLQREKEFASTLNGPFVITSLFFIPIYFFVIKKLGHAKSFKYGLLLTPIPFIIMFLSFGFLTIEQNLLIVMLGAGFYGIVGSIAIISSVPVQADFFDESAVKYQKRQEGMYSGNWNFFARLITVIQFAIIGSAQYLTGFDEKSATQTGLAQWGIMIHFTLVPAIVLFVASLLVLKYWYLNPERMKEIRTKLAESRL